MRNKKCTGDDVRQRVMEMATRVVLPSVPRRVLRLQDKNNYDNTMCRHSVIEYNRKNILIFLLIFLKNINSLN